MPSVSRMDKPVLRFPLIPPGPQAYWVALPLFEGNGRVSEPSSCSNVPFVPELEMVTRIKA